jgi:hypothetical protein
MALLNKALSEEVMYNGTSANPWLLRSQVELAFETSRNYERGFLFFIY